MSATPTSSLHASTVLIPCTEQRDGVTFYGIQLPDMSVSISPPSLPSSSATLLTRPTCFRRYSEFATFHRQILQQFPHLQLSPFPPKVWRTSEKVVQRRQTDLANYLASILNDPLLRFTPLVMDFLQLHPTPPVAPWSDRYREIHQALLHWKQSLHQCDPTTLQGMREVQRTQEKIQREWARVTNLENELETLNITPMEKTRRLNLLSNLRHEFQEIPPPPPHPLAPRPPSTQNATSLAHPMTLQDQQRSIASQDRVVEDLAQVLHRQKQLALQMQESLQEQTALLDDMRHGFSTMATKIDGATKKTKPFTS